VTQIVGFRAGARYQKHRRGARMEEGRERTMGERGNPREGSGEGGRSKAKEGRRGGLN
jgi:hypothetical protein